MSTRDLPSRARKICELCCGEFSRNGKPYENARKMRCYGKSDKGGAFKDRLCKRKKKLGLSDKPFVLVFGGSLGAEKLNHAMIDVIKKNRKKILPFSFLFGTGDRNYEKVQSALKGVGYSECIKVVPYINNMSEAMAAADLVISRSGAITLSRLPHWEKRRFWCRRRMW